MNPTASADHPRSFSKKSIGARMFVISAGVVMNVILAAILFMALFLMGYHITPSRIGGVQTNSPAQAAGLQVGDYIRRFDGDYQHDFQKLQLNTALSRANQDIPIEVERDKHTLNLKIRPEKPGSSANDFFALGVTPSFDLAGFNPKEVTQGKPLDPATNILPGDVIKAVGDVPIVDPKNDYPKLDAAIQASQGKPLTLTVEDAHQKIRTVTATIQFAPFFGGQTFNIAGLQPRTVIDSIDERSPIYGKLQSDDVVVDLRVNKEPYPNPSVEKFMELLRSAAKEEAPVDITVERQGKNGIENATVSNVTPNVRLARGTKGLGVRLRSDVQRSVVAAVVKDSPASRADIPAGALITAVNGKPVSNWFDLHAALKGAGAGAQISYIPRGLDSSASAQTKSLVFKDDERRTTVENIRYTHELALRTSSEIRKTKNPLIAAGWGVTETRDMLLQFYVTLHRLASGSISASSFMGPVGVVTVGSMFAFKGTDALIWFLAMISANLAVVNFLPIPIMDGGHFVFLLVEKVRGKPLAPNSQVVVQYIGLAIILSIFVFVTYQDIARLFL